MKKVELQLKNASVSNGSRQLSIHPPTDQAPKTIQHETDKAATLAHNSPNHLSVRVEKSDVQRRSIRSGRRFNKALTNSFILEMSPMQRGGLLGSFQLKDKSQLTIEQPQQIASAVEDDSSIADMNSTLREKFRFRVNPMGEGTYITAREAVRKMLDEYNQSVKGLPNQPEVNEALIKELELKFKCDRIVAELACRKASFKSLELALDFIYGHDPQNLHKHPFVPFKINEKELNVVKQDVEKEKDVLHIENLVIEPQTPIVVGGQRSLNVPGNEQRNDKQPRAQPKFDDPEGHMATGEIFQANQYKIRCFICKGNISTHINEGHRENLNQIERRIIEEQGSPVKLGPKPSLKHHSLTVSARQQSFLGMREYSANIALKLEREMSEAATPGVKLKKRPTIQIDGEPIGLLAQTNEVQHESSLDDLFQDTCTICYTNEIVVGAEPLTVQDKEGTFEFSCKHRFCVTCARASLKPHIENCQIEKLACPDHTCKGVVCDDDIKMLFKDEPDLIQKLYKWRQRKTDMANELYRECIKPNCKGTMIAPHKNVEYVTCSICKTKVCFKCKYAWHRGLNCEQNLDRQFTSSRFGQQKNVAFCPLCRSIIEKAEGCNHMKCYFCHYEFCWICLREATEDSGHWDKFSLTGCGAEQLDSKLNRRDLDKVRNKKLGTFFCIFMCFPLIVMYWVPHFVASIFLDQTEDRLTNWVRYPLVVLIFILCIPLGVVAIPFAIIYIIFLIFYQCCYINCCKKSRNQLAAEERIRQLTTGEDVKDQKIRTDKTDKTDKSGNYKAFDQLVQVRNQADTDRDQP